MSWHYAPIQTFLSTSRCIINISNLNQCCLSQIPTNCWHNTKNIHLTCMQACGITGRYCQSQTQRLQGKVTLRAGGIQHRDRPYKCSGSNILTHKIKLIVLQSWCPDKCTCLNPERRKAFIEITALQKCKTCACSLARTWYCHTHAAGLRPSLS